MSNGRVKLKNFYKGQNYLADRFYQTDILFDIFKQNVDTLRVRLIPQSYRKCFLNFVCIHAFYAIGTLIIKQAKI